MKYLPSGAVLLALAVVVRSAEEDLVLTCEDESLAATCSSCACSVAAVNSTVFTENLDENVGLAFGLVTAAGLSTTIGASLVFCNRLVKKEHVSVLGAALGFSGGVMLYVSFVEIFVKSVDSFAACNLDEENPCLWEDDGDGSAAYVTATICLFGGVLFTLMLDQVVQCLSRYGGSHGHSHSHDFTTSEAQEIPTPNKVESRGSSAVDAIEDHEQQAGAAENAATANATTENVVAKDKLSEDHSEHDKKRLHHMGVMTAVAIGLHNFPEGLATFVATLADPAVGAALAVAIAIHNIPEGLCVAIPLYYSSGSRFRGFTFALLSGVTEIFGAALGYLFLRTVLGDVAYGVLFGIVAGMMITIVMKELLPTAHRYDPHDKYVTSSFFVGAAVMALSLVLFVV